MQALKFFGGVLLFVVLLVVVAEAAYEPPPHCTEAATVCAQFTYTCEGKTRVSMHVEVINDTDAPQDVTFIEDVTTPDGGSGHAETSIHLKAHESQYKDRGTKGEETDTITIKHGERSLGTGSLGPADPCQLGDTRK